MMNTLIIYEGKYGTARKTAESAGYVIGNTRVLPVEEAPNDLKAYNNLVIVFSFYDYDTLRVTKCYLDEMKESLQDKQIAVIGIGLTEKELDLYVEWLRDYISVKKEYTYFVEGELHIKELSSEDYMSLKAFTQKVKMPLQDMGNWSLETVTKIAAELGRGLKTVQKPMPDKALKAVVEEFIKDHNMLALTTGSGSYVRCSPIEYIYKQGRFYLITEGGNKFRGLLQNPQVSMSIYEEYKGMNQLAGLQMTGKAVLIPLLSEKYYEILLLKDVKKEMLDRIAVNLYIIEITPSVFEFLYSPLAKEGYDAKQIYQAE